MCFRIFVEMDTSAKLRALIQAGWTQTAISLETGIPQGTISRIARGEHSDPRASNAYAVDRLYARVLPETESVAPPLTE